MVAEWKQSKHSQKDVGCTACHGADHTGASDVGNAKIARAETCAQCHKAQVEQYRRGKHSIALGSMKTQPNAHWRTMAATTGEKGCITCHRVGSPKTENELRQSKFGGIESGALGYGAAACDSCHSRHTFSAEEARQPQACQSCHSGIDNAQWEMYSSSRHGIRYDLKQRRILPPEAAAPTCQTCHMPKGDHEVLAAWGYWGIRLPLPDDPQWAADRTELMKALNIFGPLGAEGGESFLIQTLRANNSIRLTQSDWQRERDKMTAICVQCHAEDYAKQELAAADNMIRNADHLLAEAIRVLAGLYTDGVLPKPAGRGYMFPWLTDFAEPSTIIEQKLQAMYLDHRMHAVHGAFHSSPNYAIAYGLSGMQQDLAEIKDLAAELRRNHPARGKGSPAGTNGSPKKRNDP